MKKIVLLLPLIIVLCSGRENPFVSTNNDANELKPAINIESSEKPLTKTSIKPPSSARALNFVTLMYQNVNGTTTSEKIMINKKIDWRQDIVISQEPDKITTKAVNTNKQSAKYIALKKFFNIKFNGKNIKLITKDKNIRILSSSKPYKIIVDFQRKNSFYTKSQNFKNSPMKKITLGSHKEFYRATIELDGHYKYKLLKRKYGYLLKLI